MPQIVRIIDETKGVGMPTREKLHIGVPTRRSLLSRLKDWDDSRSWQDFFDTYWKLIYAVARKSGLTDAEAQDVVQEVVIQVSRKIGDLKYDPARGSFRGWLLNTTRWRINDQFRKRQRGSHGGTDASRDTRRTSVMERVPDPAGSELGALWEKEWQENLMAAAMARVRRRCNPKHYQIFDCYVIKGWAVPKVAGMLGVTHSQVYQAKHRIRTLIKDEIRKLEADVV